MERVRRFGQPLSLIVADLDWFKGINDLYGHLAGDAALRFVADTCRNGIRRIDILGRYGGEEFVILQPNTGAQQAREVVERLRESIQAGVVDSDGRKIKITASLGVAGFVPTEGISFYDLMAEADRALYRAKSRGRNRVQMAETRLDDGIPLLGSEGASSGEPDPETAVHLQSESEGHPS